MSPARTICAVWVILSSLVVLGLLTASTHPWSKAITERVKSNLFQEISQRQVSDGHTCIPPSSQPLRQTGVYDCMVRFNFAGHCWQTELRHRLAFFDNNPFVPIWVSLLLLEAHLYGAGIKPSEQQLSLALEYLKTTMDKTRDYENSLIGFYPYEFDKTQNKYVMKKVFVEEILYMFQNLPTPLLKGFSYILPEPLKHALVLQSKNDNSTLSGCLGEVSEEQIRQEIANSGFMVMQYHTVSPVFPADSDDTFSWLGLGGMLKMAKDQRGIFSRQLQTWLDLNVNITSAFEALKQYSYRPFSQDPSSNTIDSRSYFALRSFLDQAKMLNEDIALVTTWFMNIREELSGQQGDMTMPTFVNDVCLAVGANVIYGITSTILNGLVPLEILDDPGIVQLLHNTSSLIDHMIQHDFHQRQDLILFYYPPRNQFYFFLSRSFFLLNMYGNIFTEEGTVLHKVYTSLKTCLEGKITDDLIHKGQKDSVFGTIYFDDFVGAGDIAKNGNTVRRGEDRIFSTSMAANTLIYTWAVFDRITSSLSWKPDVSQDVIRVTRGCVHWLLLHATDQNFKPWNAFFSSGRKGLRNLPFWYPANRFQFINGSYLTLLDTQTKLPVDMFFAAMQGYVQTEQYESMLNRSHFGDKTPTTFPGYNAKDWNSFAFWSSEAYSYASALLAISLFDRLV